ARTWRARDESPVGVRRLDDALDRNRCAKRHQRDPSAVIAHRPPARAGNGSSSRSGAGQEAGGRPLPAPATHAEPERRATADRSTHAQVAARRRLRAQDAAARLTCARRRRADRRRRTGSRVEPWGEKEGAARSAGIVTRRRLPPGRRRWHQRSSSAERRSQGCTLCAPYRLASGTTEKRASGVRVRGSYEDLAGAAGREVLEQRIDLLGLTIGAL